MSLYLKYRPQDFDEVIGNEATVRAIANKVERDCPHAILLTGPTGCGKTTIGRIVAGKLGSSGADFAEIDSADFRGIDTVREIRKKTTFKPIEGDARVFMIDECHKLTNDAQNALLKILEDTPSHVYFILCTTDPQKLIKTVKGRCMTFELSTLDDEEMMGLLRKVVKKEDESLQKTVYKQIILDAQGHPRNALQILDRVLGVEDEDERLDVAKSEAEKVSQSIELCQMLIKGTGWKKVAEVLKGLKQENPESIRRHVLGYASAVALNSGQEKAIDIIDAFSDPLYDIGFPGLVLSCYNAVHA